MGQLSTGSFDMVGANFGQGSGVSDSMDSGWSSVERVLDELLDLPKDQRPAQLEVLCPKPGPLRDEVERLLAADEAAAHIEALSLNPPQSAMPQSGDRIGVWRLGDCLGIGGMGMVFAAARDDGLFQQKGALKLVRGRIDQALERRFTLERETLAKMEHPNIARILDGGVEESGRPYLVMEYVDGLPIDQYCANHHLGLAQRLALFAQVCEGIAHAHGRLVVHRDIKPANVLVTPAGQVKLLDFGIAKLLDAHEQQETVTGAALLTPSYAAPEQVLGGEITAATDVYGLGALLYQLLTGRPPLSAEGGSLPELLKRVRDQRPLPLSQATDAVVSATGESADKDLDLICLTALNKEAGARYSSVQALADDLARYREGRPLRAAPPSFGYRAGKFLRRHRFAVSLTTLVAVLLITATAIALWQAEVARSERDASRRQADVAQEALDFLVGTFRVEVRQNVEPEDVTALDLLHQGVQRIESDSDLEAEVRAPLLRALGSAYRNMAQFDEAMLLLEQALESAESSERIAPLERIDYRRTLAFALMSHGDYERAAQILKPALDELSKSPDSPTETAAQVYQTDGLIAHFSGDYETSVERHRQAIAVYDALSQTENAASARLGLGNSLFRLARVEDSLTVTQLAVEMLEGMPEPPVRALGRGYNDLALRRYGIGDLSGAEAAFDAMTRELVEKGDDDLGTGDALYMGNQAGMAVELGMLEKAQQLSSRSLARREALLNPGSGYLAGGRVIQGIIDIERGEFESAHQRLSQAAEVIGLPTSAGNSRQLGLVALTTAARLHAGETVAIEALAESLPQVREHAGVLSRTLVYTLQTMVEAVLSQRNVRWREQARSWSQELVEITETQWPEDAWRRHWARALYLLASGGEFAQPGLAYDQTISKLKQCLPNDSWRLDWIARRRAELTTS